MPLLIDKIFEGLALAYNNNLPCNLHFAIENLRRSRISRNLIKVTWYCYCTVIKTSRRRSFLRITLHTLQAFIKLTSNKFTFDFKDYFLNDHAQKSRFFMRGDSWFLYPIPDIEFCLNFYHHILQAGTKFRPSTACCAKVVSKARWLPKWGVGSV